MSFSNGLRLVRVARVDIDRHHLETGAAELAPRSASSVGISLRQGTHQVAHRLSSTVRPRQSASVSGLPVASVEREVGHLQRALGNVNGGHLAMRQRRQFLGQFDRRPAGRVAARIAREGRNPVYPREPNDDAGDAARQNHGEALLGDAGLRMFGHDRRNLGGYEP